MKIYHFEDGTSWLLDINGYYLHEITIFQPRWIIGGTTLKVVKS